LRIQTSSKAPCKLRVEALFHSEIIIVKVLFVVVLVAVRSLGLGKRGLRDRNDFLIAQLDLLGLVRLPLGLSGRADFGFGFGWLLALRPSAGRRAVVTARLTFDGAGAALRLPSAVFDGLTMLLRALPQCVARMLVDATSGWRA
jgi:hypothetical protein